MNAGWIPNAITLARMLLSAPLAWLILDQRYAPALALALAAGLSDALDGLLAKRFGWQSRLGGLLDPLADKLMLLASFAALTLVGEVPLWLCLLIVGRDLVIVAGAVAYHNLVGPLNAAPSSISKLTTVLQITLVLAELVDGLKTVALPAWGLTGLEWLTAAATVASGLHYVVYWSAKARREWRARA